MEKQQRVTLTDAGLRAGLGYWSIRDAVMKGRVKGGKGADGWWVDATDLERFVAERAASQAAHQRSAPSTAGNRDDARSRAVLRHSRRWCLGGYLNVNTPVKGEPKRCVSNRHGSTECRKGSSSTWPDVTTGICAETPRTSLPAATVRGSLNEWLMVKETVPVPPAPAQAGDSTDGRKEQALAEARAEFQATRPHDGPCLTRCDRSSRSARTRRPNRLHTHEGRPPKIGPRFRPAVCCPTAQVNPKDTAHYPLAQGGRIHEYHERYKKC